MKAKYQIFVSSTYEDLKEERDSVIKAILEMGHIPVGMEMFSAGDEEQWQLIKKQIDDCDYYVVIVAFRYGSMDADISYTEKEYKYAASIGVPTLGFLVNDSVSWPASKVDKEAIKVEKLNSFKEKIKKKLISFWDNKNDLYGKVSISLMKQFNTNPRIGWVRADQYSGPEILKEISRLSKENSELRQQIQGYNIEANKEEKTKIDKTLDVLKHNKRELSFFYLNGKNWEDGKEFTLFNIFNQIAPQSIIEVSTNYCSTYLALMLKPQKNNTRKEWPTPSNTIRRILGDLNILGLIAPSGKKHKIDDSNEYWTLTSFGKEIYKLVRQEILEKNLPIDKNIDVDKELKPGKQSK